MQDEKSYFEAHISHFTKAIEIDPELSLPYNQKAWLLATCSDTIYRDGAKSVELAEKAVELNPGTDYLDTLAAAYAEAGRFEDAIATQEKVIKKRDGIQYFQRGCKNICVNGHS
jgi:tetratricopeptide (TPR) repeat protein